MVWKESVVLNKFEDEIRVPANIGPALCTNLKECSV